MLEIYERVKGPFRSRKHEFVYEDGYPLREGRMFWLVYTKGNKVEMFVDYESTPIFPRDPRNKTIFGQYTEAKEGLRREIYLKSFTPIITKTMRENGSINRAFAKYVFDKDTIFEIDKGMLGMSNLYHYVSLEWEISGIKENVQKNNIQSLEVADEEMSGMRFLLNPLEFYIEEVTEENRKQTLLERLLHNPHTYGHQSQASNVGSALGLTGTHTMPDGSVMPGSTHQEYLNALRRNQEITTSSGTTIPTQNLRRNSGY